MKWMHSCKLDGRKPMGFVFLQNGVITEWRNEKKGLNAPDSYLTIVNISIPALRSFPVELAYHLHYITCCHA